MSDTIWVNTERTVMASLWPGGELAVALRSEPADVWGPPIRLAVEQAPIFAALAADLEDVLLRWHGHAGDAETVRAVADSLLDLGPKEE